jgi:UDP-glucose 4-epimerase
MNILVTGGAGFIASHIVDQLITSGHEVHVLDNLSTGRKENVNPKAIFHQMDLLDGRLPELFAFARPEVVIHHAAQSNVQTSLKHPLQDAKINITGTIAILEQCMAYGVRKLIYASTAAVYGTPEYLGIDERHPIKPFSFYGISKYSSENYIEAYSSLCGLDYTIFRYANVYGSRQDPKGEGGGVSIFLDKLLHGHQPLIFGNGEQTRDFIYIKDIVSANIAALKQGNRGLYNIGWNEQTSIVTMLQDMCEITGRPFNPIFKPARASDIVHSRLDNRAVAAKLDWKPVYTLKDGLQETIDFYRKQKAE